MTTWMEANAGGSAGAGIAISGAESAISGAGSAIPGTRSAIPGAGSAISGAGSAVASTLLVARGTGEGDAPAETPAQGVGDGCVALPVGAVQRKAGSALSGNTVHGTQVTGSAVGVSAAVGRRKAL